MLYAAIHQKKPLLICKFRTGDISVLQEGELQVQVLRTVSCMQFCYLHIFMAH